MDVLTALSHGLEGRAYLSLLAALGWGAASVLLSPCHLASLPLIVAFIGGQQVRGTARAFRLALVFSIGVLVTIAALGLVSAAAGRLLGDVGPAGAYTVAALLVAIGLQMLGVIRLPFGTWGQPAAPRQAERSALVLGLVFGTALGPCTFAYLAPVLVVTFRLSASNLWLAIGLLLAYAVGHCAVLVAAGTAAERVQRYLEWSRTSRALDALKAACAISLILAGLYFVYTAR